MKFPGKLTVLFLFSLLIVACAGTAEPEDPAGPANQEGPALIMFYTDN